MFFIETFKLITIFFLGLIFLNFLRKYLFVSQLRVNILYLYHTIFLLIRYYYGENYPDDAPTYYDWAVLDVYYYNFTFKSHFYLVFFIRQLNSFFFLNYIQICFIFNIIGTLSLILLTSVFQNIKFRDYNNSDKTIILLFILMPSLNFYTSTIGKDTLVIFAASTFLYAVLNIKNRFLLIIFSLSIIGLIRPYIFFFFFLALIILYIINFFRSSFTNNIILGLILSFTFIYLPVTVLKEYGIDLLNIELLIKTIEDRQLSLSHQRAGTYTNINEMFFFLRPLNYLFRPVIFESINPLFIVTSLENLLLVFIFIHYFFKIKIKNIFETKNTQYILILSILILLFLSNITPVLGIAIRQKWIVLIFIFYLFLYSSNKIKEDK